MKKIKNERNEQIEDASIRGFDILGNRIEE